MSTLRYVTRAQLASLRAQIVDLANPAAAAYLREDTGVTALSILRRIERQIPDRIDYHEPEDDE